MPRLGRACVPDGARSLAVAVIPARATAHTSRGRRSTRGPPRTPPECKVRTRCARLAPSASYPSGRETGPETPPCNNSCNAPAGDRCRAARAATRENTLDVKGTHAAFVVDIKPALSRNSDKAGRTRHRSRQQGKFEDRGLGRVRQPGTARAARICVSQTPDWFGPGIRLDRACAVSSREL